MNKRITTDILKITAMVSMLTDHVAVAFAGFGMPAGIYWTMRCIGRLAFPIYVYFLVQGYIYTHSVGKYAIRLGLLAVISEIPYDMTVYGCFFDFRHNNVLFTLVLALLVLWATDSLYKKNRWLDRPSDTSHWGLLSNPVDNWYVASLSVWNSWRRQSQSFLPIAS